MGYRIVKKDVKPSTGAAAAFMAQRGQESGSQRLRAEVAAMLQSGRAHTRTVAKVFELLINTDTDRFGKSDVERVLPGFTVENDGW